MENLSLEVKDFEGAVKLQGVMMEKISAQRKADPGEKGKEKKMTETQRAVLEAKIMQVVQYSFIQFFIDNFFKIWKILLLLLWKYY